MGTKQVQMEFQVVADNGISANVTVTVGGVQKFSGALAQTTDVLVPADTHYDTTPFSLVQFDLDVANVAISSTPPWNQAEWVTPTNITVLVTGGDVILQEIEANYSAIVEALVPPATTPKEGTLVPGNATDFQTTVISNQPLWDDVAITDYYNYTGNENTGSGNLPIPNGMTMACQINMSLYNDGTT